MIPDYLKNGSSYGGWNPLKWGGELGYWWGSRSTDTSGGIYTDPDTGEQIPMQEMQDRMIAAGMLPEDTPSYEDEARASTGIDDLDWLGRDPEEEEGGKMPPWIILAGGAIVAGYLFLAPAKKGSGQ
jgi:hypothetical protein